MCFSFQIIKMENKIEKLVKNYHIKRESAEQVLNNTDGNYDEAAKFFEQMYDSNSRIDIFTQASMYGALDENDSEGKKKLDRIIGTHKFPDSEIEEMIKHK
jgi:hypothetical protein